MGPSKACIQELTGHCGPAVRNALLLNPWSSVSLFEVYGGCLKAVLQDGEGEGSDEDKDEDLERQVNKWYQKAKGGQHHTIWAASMPNQ